MSTIELSIINLYWEMLKSLSDDIKLKLATMLTNSVVENRQKERSATSVSLTEQMIAKYAGALEDERQADEIVSEIKQSHSIKPIQEFTF